MTQHTSDVVTARLSRLPSPQPPADLSPAVLARIVQIDEARTVGRHAAGARPVRTPARIAIREWTSWAAVFVGMAVASGAAVSLWSWDSFATVSRAQLAASASTAGVLVLGLALYAAGLLTNRPQLRDR